MTEYRGTPTLVLGGFGFIGHALTLRLVAARARVRVMTPDAERHGPSVAAARAAGVEVIEGDIRDAAMMARAVERQQVVFHLAGQSGAVRSMETPAADLDVNAGGSLVLLESLKARNREARVVFVGSRLEYGEATEATVAEGHPAEPLCIYGIHKLVVEHYLRLYRRLYGMPSVVARVTNPYGPGQPSHRTAYGIVNRLVHLALNDEVLTIYGDGSQRRDYIYVEDTVDALLACGVAPEADGRVYNVGTGVGTRMIDLARTIVRLAGRGRVESVAWPDLAGRIETGDFVADVSRIGTELGWRPTVALEEGLERTIAGSRGHA